MKKSICIIMIAIVLFINIFNCNKVKCSEVAVGGSVVVTVGEAIAFLLTAFGLTAAADAVYQNGDSIKEWGNNRVNDFLDYCTTTAHYTGEALDDCREWLTGVSRGVIDKSSDAWSLFKDWTTSIYDGLSSSSSDDDSSNPHSVNLPNTNSKIVLKKVDATEGFSTQALYTKNGAVGIQVIRYYSNSITYFSYVVSSKDVDASVLLGSSKINITSKTDKGYYIGMLGQNTILTGMSGNIDGWYIADGGVLGTSISNTQSISVTDITQEQWQIIKSQDADAYSLVGQILGYGGSAEKDSVWCPNGGISDIYDRDKSLDNVDVIGVGVGTNINDDKVVIDWDKVVVDGTIAGTITDVHDGTKDVNDILVDTGATVIDLTDGKVIDKDKVIESVVSDKELSDYKVGLAEIFPFCLPFDLIKFIGCLAADPQAPRFEIPIKYPTSLDFKKMSTYNIVIDFEQFETVAEIVRIMETLLFIIGLVVITRSHMIRG